MTPFRLHSEILGEAQRVVLGTFGWTGKVGFVLYEGTAVALRYGHRASVDFDFFTDRQLSHDEITAQFHTVKLAFAVVQNRPNTLTLQTQPGDVRTSFFGGVEFGRVAVPDRAPDNHIMIAAPLDLLATKLKVILQRPEAKDYLDIVELLRHGTDILQGLSAASALYGPTFAPAESLRSLTCFQDGDLPNLDAAMRRELVSAATSKRDFQLPEVAIKSKRLSVDDPRLGH